MIRRNVVAPLVAAIASIATVWFVWGELAPTPKIQDEHSYLLQADIFARGRWTAPSPAIPEFFEQPHVLVVPAVASKYPPGHALLLSVGAFVGFRALVPLLLTGFTAAMIVLLVRRLASEQVALLTWAVWVTSPIVLRFQASYLSELTTAALVLASWWALLEWRDSRRLRWLLILAAAVGWGAITRPLTMLAFALPIGVIVVRDAWRLRHWRSFAAAVALGTAILAIVPVWSANTTGDWRLTPLELYRRDYLPFDRLGFTPDTTPPRRAVSPVLEPTYEFFRVEHEKQSLSAVPRVAASRAGQLALGFFPTWRVILALLAIAGLVAMAAPVRFALASAALLFATHLAYAHWAPWTVYYLEVAPVVSLLVALGCWTLTRRIVSARRRRIVAIVTPALLLIVSLPSIGRWRRDHLERSAFDRRFAASLAKVPTPAIVFIRYSPRVAQHVGVVANQADLEHAPVWIVHDLGARNDELRRAAPDRASFDFEEEQLIQRRNR